MEKANQKLESLKMLWEAKRSGRAMPSRAEFDVFELRPWLGNLALIDLAEAGGGRFRLCGVGLFIRFAGDKTGCRMADLCGEYYESFRAIIARAQDMGAPVEDRHSAIIEGWRITFDELVLPLSGDGTRPTTLLFASYKTNLERTW
ncbi:MAG: PAS domain-containing protein [Alphaproteobacteria bacterium]|nr:PAS domain-containing protein [Alphaproteobacteria bacterium]